jgi:NAD+ diphosphatase
MRFNSLFRFCPVCGSIHFENHNVKSKRCGGCGFVMYINPAAAVAAFVLNNRGEILVCERAKEPHRGTLDLPGGFVDELETAEQAVVRELKEELQLEAAKPGYLFSLPNEYLYSGWTLPTLDMFYLVQTNGDEQLVASDDVASCYYISPEKLDPAGFGLSSIRKAVSMFKSDFINNRVTDQ